MDMYGSGCTDMYVGGNWWAAVPWMDDSKSSPGNAERLLQQAMGGSIQHSLSHTGHYILACAHTVYTEKTRVRKLRIQ